VHVGEAELHRKQTGKPGDELRLGVQSSGFGARRSWPDQPASLRRPRAPCVFFRAAREKTSAFVLNRTFPGKPLVSNCSGGGWTSTIIAAHKCIGTSLAFKS
jgi:hypothetical protein